MAHPVCPSCQRHLSADFLKCPYCGAALEIPEDPAPAVTVEEPVAVPEEKEEYIPDLKLESNPFAELSVIAETFPAKRICPKCGREAEPDAAFCIICGTRISG